MCSKNRLTTFTFYVFYVFCLLSSLSNGAKKKTQPNIIFLLMDDIGWNDVSFNMGQFPTPNIDSLKNEGVSLTKHYIHLMCSPSRSQIITGRYAMYQGFGKMLPWDYTEIGGLPQGQPTIASWLKWGGYKTYAVGKWHLGYAADILLPTNRGFDHFYGFYQGAIHYDNMKYIDIKYGDSNHFDFWEDTQEMKELANNIAERHEKINEYLDGYDLRDNEEETVDYSGQSIFDDNTMYLYRDKILQYIDQQIYNENGKKKKHMEPFYMYLALQTIHGPLNEVPEKVEECTAILPDDVTNRRQKYCQNMLLTDDVIGEIINKLKEKQDVWDNTLIVFTSDNGGDIANKGCNYPLRGTKGTLFDGNLKTIALISGGVIPSEQHGTERDVLFSSLDWTPTLLKYANLLSKIDKKSTTWDGINQYDLIMNGVSDDIEDKTESDKKIRDHIVLNIGLKNLDSASIVFEYPADGKLYKYISKYDGIDRWAYIRDDGWCIPDDDGNFNLIMDEEISMAKDVDNRFLFDLTGDIAEKVNLLQLDDNYNNELIEYAKGILAKYTDHYLFSEPLTFLWNRLPAGNPALLGEGAFVSPFLNDEEYTFHVRKGFHSIDEKTEEIAQEKGILAADIQRYSKALQSTYFNRWQPPTADIDDDDITDADADITPQRKRFAVSQTSQTNDNHNNMLYVFVISTVIVVLYGLYKCYYSKYFKNKNKYQSIIDILKTDKNNNDEKTALIQIN